MTKIPPPERRTGERSNKPPGLNCWDLALAIFTACGIVLALVTGSESAEPQAKVFRAGALAVDITPTIFPVIVSGGFEERTANKANDSLYARALVLDDGPTRLAIVVVDSLMLPRELLDEAKDVAAKATGIPTDRILISATHTHSAPAAMGCLGSRDNPEYKVFLSAQIARSIQLAQEQLRPARIGWRVVKDSRHTFNRRWIRRPDRLLNDPFGQPTVRANMHPGYQNTDAIGPSGPVDDDLSLLSVQSIDGKPLAVLANYSQHYYGSTPVSADYFGRFVHHFTKLIGADNTNPAFVAAMSQGTSGDLMWMDYDSPKPRENLEQYSAEVAEVASRAFREIEYQDWVPLAMRETKLTLDRRVPDEARLAWARRIDADTGERQPRTLPEVYAREQLFLAAEPQRELKLQALRIGDLGITAIPNEVFALTGLKLKAASPLATTFNIELAGGGEGYIPPPEQHKLGGYTTWPARTASLEVNAEPKIVEALLKLLEEVAGRPRRKVVDPAGAYAEAVLASKPTAYWRLAEMQGPLANDAVGSSHPATYEDGVAFYLPGPAGKGMAAANAVNRAAHFAGGRLRASLDQIGATYTVELWAWNGLPNDARPVTGYLFSRGAEHDDLAPGDHLGIGGTAVARGCLFFFNGNKANTIVAGQNPLAPKSWNHVVLVRDGAKVTIYLNGRAEPEASGEAAITRAPGDPLLIGGRNDNFANFEGKIDEVAIYARALSASEIAAHYATSGEQEPPLVSRTPTPTEAADSLAQLHVRPGFEVELVAAEPLVLDPVAIEWGPDGKLWVAEMADYPLGIDGNMKAGGRVRYLEDTDGDGRYDRSTLFLDGVNFPTGVLPWHKGVLVTAAPEVFYAEDTDGDGKADLRRTLYRGFVEGNPQLRVNGLQRGLDGWVYLANGWSGGVVRSEKTGETASIAGRDLRIKPDEGLLDPISGVTEFGRNRDDWGNWFGCDNSNPLFHFVLEDHYTRRNPLVAPPDAKRQLMVPPNPPIFARSEPQKRYHSFEQAGRFTSACGAIVYRDDLLFGSDGPAHAFICEPVHNLVHHELLTDDGVSFQATRDKAEAKSEFLASEDPWFRPVMVRTGPDGALWVVDMYRFMIEHPGWLPPLGQQELAPYFRLGEDRGRIYRIYPRGHKPKMPAWPAKKNTAALMAEIESPNGWRRDTAQQLLTWQNDPAAPAALEKLVTESSQPKARLQALCTLDVFGKLRAPVVERALADPHPAVRRQALRSAEKLAATDAKLLAAALALAADSDAKVRFQLASSLGVWSDPRAGRVLGELAAQAGDPYSRIAAMSSVTKDNLDPMLAGLLASSTKPASGGALELALGLAAAMGRGEALVDAILQTAESDKSGQYAAWQMTAVARALDALDKRGQSLTSLDGAAPDKVKSALSKVAAIQAAARTILPDSNQSEQSRASAAGLMLGDTNRRAAELEIFEQLLVPQTPPAVQGAIVDRLGQQQDAAAAQAMLAGWQSHSPALRSQILVLLLSRAAWVLVLLDAIETSKQVLPADIDAARRQQLAALPDARQRDRANRLLALASCADRGQALKDFEPALNLTGDIQRGAALFEKKCSVCHKLGSIGNDVGPNLAALTDRAPRSLLVAILDPSRAVEARYVSYLAVTTDGRSLTGILETETGGSITLLGEQAKRQTVLRADLEALRSSGKSLMPDGLERDLSPQDMADLLAFVARAGQP